MGLFFSYANQVREVWSVSQLTTYIRELFEIDFRLQEIIVEGEISNFIRARSGHLYFTVKDDRAQLKCVMWQSSAEWLRFRPGDGDAVVLYGRVSVYEANGVYQLYVDRMEPAGRGNLAIAFENLKAQLAGEGLFDSAHKKAIPALPGKIGIVTSADGAALQDILNVLQRRCALAAVLIAPCLVQGAEAPGQIVRSLRWLDGRTDIDTIIIARGGGSLEDLWAFNDESVARAIFEAQHPIICGVGHETDFTIADFVADLRAPTPSAAAELAVPDLADFRPALQAMQAALVSLMSNTLRQERWRLGTLARALRQAGPQRNLDSNRQRLDTLVGRLDSDINRRFARQESRLAVASAALTAFNPKATLARGYAIVRQRDGRLVRQVSNVAAGDKLAILVSDGSFEVVVSNKSLD